LSIGDKPSSIATADHSASRMNEILTILVGFALLAALSSPLPVRAEPTQVESSSWDGPAREKAEYQQLRMNAKHVDAIVDRHRTELKNKIPDVEKVTSFLDVATHKAVILVQTTQQPSADTLRTAPKEIEGLGGPHTKGPDRVSTLNAARQR
jgi:hypothetical protein